MRKKDYAIKNLRSIILDLHQYTAGKSIGEIAHKYKLDPSKILKLGSNENVLGSSLKAKIAATLALEKVNIYPEVVSTELASKIKKIYKLKNIEVVVGNGMDQILEMLARLFLNNGDETIISVPTFTPYELSTLWAGAKPKLIPLLKNTCQMNIEKILKTINKKTKMIFICSPNNPTGNLMKKEDIKKIIESTDKIIFLDEAYIEFGGKSLLKWVNKYPNLIVGRTFSKIYGLAGYRVGYAFIHKNLAKYYFNSITPFVVSRPGQAAALGALDDHDFFNKSVKMVNEGKDFYYKELTKAGIKFLPTDANFITLNTFPKKAKLITEDLMQSGIITRECSSFGTGGEYMLRITIGTSEQNKRVLDALKQI
ncbi:MAG: histidinol-phosphate transaminase [Candidatus Melainabacteria bacterium RIFCSPLOWO2_02_FULL_35_15]|nr:MAG: histidinol-phosphate transaminase [Candidatus Melainabacteria bacterium RIFCSPLOWO2_12_FULL_35_11]OGI14310.1 MAG: histidinol-phosphate transaminase [Candidatus Melainabacteria bacterium RIFCSPLOWO2_02_FULL_35_15]